MTYAGVDVQNAHLAGARDLADRVDLGAVQVALVLAVLQELARPSLPLHLVAAHEVIAHTVGLSHARLAARVWADGGDQR